MRSKLIGQSPEYYKLYEISRKLEQITRIAPHIGWNNYSNSQGGEAYSEVTDYAANVIAAGGTLQAGDETLLRAFKDSMVANGTWMGYEFYPFLGGFSGCLQKLNPINEAVTALTNNLFVSGDYSESFGLYNNGNKWLGTGIIPDNNSLAYNNISFGGYIVDQVNASAHYFFASRPAAGGMQIYAGKNAIGLAGGTVQKLCPAPGTGVPTFLGVSLRTTESIFRFHYADLLPPSPNATVPTTQTLPDELTIFQAKSFGATINATGKIAFAFLGPSMTRAQMDVLTEAIETLLVAKGRLTQVSELIVIGDSYTYGNQSSAYNTRYTYLLASELGLRERNFGIGGATLRTSSSQLYSEYDRRAQLLNCNYTNANSLIVLASGLNDARADAGATGTPATIADAKTKRKAEINELLAAGIASNKIIGWGIPYIEDGTPDGRLQAWNTAMQEACTETGTRFADVYTVTKANWATIKYTDNIHVTDSGHVLLKDATRDAV